MKEKGEVMVSLFLFFLFSFSIFLQNIKASNYKALASACKLAGSGKRSLKKRDADRIISTLWGIWCRKIWSSTIMKRPRRWSTMKNLKRRSTVKNLKRRSTMKNLKRRSVTLWLGLKRCFFLSLAVYIYFNSSIYLPLYII